MPHRRGTACAPIVEEPAGALTERKNCDDRARRVRKAPIIEKASAAKRRKPDQEKEEGPPVMVRIPRVPPKVNFIQRNIQKAGAAKKAQKKEEKKGGKGKSKENAKVPE